MSVICGWHGPRGGTGHEDIDRMAAALFPARGEPESLETAGGGVCAVGSGATLARRADTSVVLTGHAHLAGRPEHGIDAVQLLDLYREHGTGVAAHVGGRFAFAVLDSPRRLAILAVDRLGREPLAYWTGDDGTLVFASTVTGVVAHRAVTAQVDPQAILNYLYHQVIPSPRTIYRDVAKLQPGQQLVLHGGQPKLTLHWLPDFGAESADSEPQLSERLHELLHQAIAAHADSPRTGAFLSGGLDSSTVSGVLRAARREPVKCFTIGFDKEGYDELEFARIATEHFDNELIHYYVTADDVAATIPEITRTYDEPFGNSSAIPALWCARLAAQHGVDTLLAGDGGDELFSGNERYRKQLAYSWYHELPRPVRYVLNGLADRSPGPQARGLRRIAHYLDMARATLPQRLNKANFLNVWGMDAIFAGAFLDQIDRMAPGVEVERWYDAAPAGGVLKNMLFLDWKITLADNDLRKVTRMCDLAGTTVHFPLLDDAIVDFASALPERFLMPKLKLRHFFKESMRDLLPAAIINKTKHGFGLPLGQWLNEHEQLRTVTEQSLHALAERNIVRPEFVGRLQDAHRNEHPSYYGALVWVFTMLEQWLQQHAAATRY